MSEVILGETINLILNSNKDFKCKKEDIIYELFNLIDNKIILIFRPTVDELEIMSDLIFYIKNNDDHLHTNDILALSLSMLDLNCDGLLTFDGDILNSRTVNETLRKKLPDRKKYEVTDYLYS